MPDPQTFYTDGYQNNIEEVVAPTFLFCLGMGYMGGFYLGENEISGVETISVERIYTDVYI